jgi:hypothetical protein
MQSILDMYIGRISSPTASTVCEAIALLEHGPRIASPLTSGGEMRGPTSLEEVKMPECGRCMLGSTGCEASKDETRCRI